jgi:recombination protein RecA
MYGNPETTTGGKALKFYATMRLDVRKIGQPNKEGNEAVSHTVKIKVIKNKVAPPFKEVELTIGYGTGFDQLSDLVGLASDYEIIKKAGSFYSYNDDRIGQGKDKAIAYIKERPALQQEIRDKVLTVIRSGREFVAELQTETAVAALPEVN